MLPGFSSIASRPKIEWGIIAGVGFSALAILAPLVLLEPFWPFISSLFLNDQNLALSLARILSDGLSLGLIVAAIFVYGQRLQSIGLGRITWLHLGKAAVGFGFYFLLAALIRIITAEYFPVDLEQPQDLGYDQQLGIVSMAVAFISLVIVTPIVEEVIFRGFMFNGLRRRLPFWLTALIVSALFGLAHFQWNVGLNVFALSLVACYLREQSGSLWPCILLHTIKNGVAFYLLYLYNGG